jgi:hypothetical protein
MEFKNPLQSDRHADHESTLRHNIKATYCPHVTLFLTNVSMADPEVRCYVVPWQSYFGSFSIFDWLQNALSKLI